MSQLDNMSWIKTNGVVPMKGRLLISEPFLEDLYFQRAVILLVDNAADGAFGVILNKELDNSFNEIVLDFPEFNAPIFFGGPIAQESLFFIHNLGDEIPDSVEIIPGIYWGGDVQEVKNLIKMGIAQPKNFKFFLGYSGWEPNQLGEELENNSWIINTTSPQQVFSTEIDQLWEENVRKLGGEYLYWLNFPIDPAFN